MGMGLELGPEPGPESELEPVPRSALDLGLLVPLVLALGCRCWFPPPTQEWHALSPSPDKVNMEQGRSRIKLTRHISLW